MNGLGTLLGWAYRAMALLVLACVLAFPAYKGVWMGYAPVLAGCAMGLWLARRGGAAIARDEAPPRAAAELAFGLRLVILPALAQAALLLAYRPEPWFDGRFVVEEARRFAETGLMSPLTYYPPAQTWWYALWFRLCGGGTLVAQFSQVPLGAAVALATYALARRALPPTRARTVAWAVALYPSFIGYVLVTPYYHYLYTALTVAMGWWMLRAADQRSGHASGFAAGLFAGAGALAKAVQLVAPAQAFVLWLALLPPDPASPRRPRLGAVGGLCAMFLLGMAVVVGPWAQRNLKVFGEPVLVCTSGGLVLYSANNPESNGLYSSLPDEVAIASPGAMLAYSRHCSRQARDYILGHPARFAELAWRKFLHTWGNESAFTDLINRRGQPSPRAEKVFSAVFLAGWSTLVSLWAAASWRGLRRRIAVGPVEALAAVLVLSNAAVYLVFEGGDRHHLPLVPLLAVAAASLLARGDKESA